MKTKEKPSSRFVARHPDSLLAPPRGRIAGSHPTAPMLRRRRDDDQDFPGPDDDTPPPPPKPKISAPDLAMQFVPCLEEIPVPPGYDLKKAVIDAVKLAVGPDADVRYECAQHSGRIGIWLRPAGDAQVGEARDRGMDLIRIIKPGENFAVWVSAGQIKSKAAEAWEKTDKRLDHEGKADPDGPVHLTSLVLEFVSPNRVLTRVKGFDEAPWPDVDFTLTVTDAFSVSAGQVRVASDTDLDADTTWLNVLTGVFFVLGAFVSPWFFLGALVFGAEGVIVGTVDPGDRGGGAGSAAAQNIPKEFYIEGGQKLVATYSRIDVNAGGITAGGVALPVPRIPAISIVGPTLISVPEGTTRVSRTFQVNSDDMRGAIRYAWSGGGQASQQARVASVTFDVAKLKPGGHATRTIQVDAVDADGLDARATHTVSVHMTRDSDDLGLPPICRHKPWLPQCQI